jgi:hypothetical protein
MKIAIFSFILLLPFPAWGVECRAVNVKEFRDATKQGPTRVLFFASWCSSCSRSITPDRIADSIFIASADEQSKAEKVLSTYLKDRAAEAHCYFDKDGSIAKAFGVRNLPQEKSLHDLPKP